MSGDKIGFKYLANKYVGVFITAKIGRNFGVLFLGVVPAGQILSNSFSEI